jgi:hypothetical protein
LLAVLFSGPEAGSQFVDAHLWVNVSDDAIDAPLLDYFSSPRASSPQGGGA